MIEVTVSRRVLMWGGGLFLIVMFFLIGVAVSPRVQGRPVLLSPRNRALFGYLDRVELWHEALVREADTLDRLTPESEQAEEEEALPLFATPVPRAASLYQRMTRVQDVLARLDALALEVETTVPPRGMEGMHRQVLETVRLHILWAEAVADYLAAPSAHLAGKVREAREEAGLSRRLLGETLARHRLMVSTPAPTPSPEAENDGGH